MDSALSLLCYRGRLFAFLQGVCAFGTLGTFWALFYWPIVIAMLLGYSAYLSYMFFSNPFSQYVVFQVRILQYVITFLALAEGITALVLMVSWSNGAAYLVGQIIAVIVSVATLFVSFVLWATMNQLLSIMSPGGATVRHIPAVSSFLYDYGDQNSASRRSARGGMGYVENPPQRSSRVAIVYPSSASEHAPFGSPNMPSMHPAYTAGPADPSSVGPAMPPRFPLARFESSRALPFGASPPPTSPTPFSSYPAAGEPQYSHQLATGTHHQSSIFAERRHPSSAVW